MNKSFVDRLTIEVRKLRKNGMKVYNRKIKIISIFNS